MDDIAERRKLETRIDFLIRHKDPTVSSLALQAQTELKRREWKKAGDLVEKARDAIPKRQSLIDFLMSTKQWKTKAMAKRAIESGIVVVDGYAIRRADYDVTGAKTINAGESILRQP